MITSSKSPSAPPNYLLLFVKEWKIVVAGGVVCTVLAALVYLAGPKTYESSSMVIIYPPFFKSGGSRPSANRLSGSSGDTALLAEGLSELMPQTLPVETYKEIAESRGTLQEILVRLDLTDTDVEELEKKCTVVLTPLGSRSPQFGTVYSQTLVFAAEWSNAEDVAKIAQIWAEIFKDKVDALNETGVSETYDLVETMRKEAKTELEDAENELRDFEVDWDLVLIEAKRLAKQENLTAIEEALVQVEIDIAMYSGTLERLQEDLANEKKVIETFRSPSDDALYLWPKKNAAGGAENVGAGVGFLTEEVNPSYTAARDLEIEVASNLQGAVSQKAATIQKISALTLEIEELDDNLVKRKVEQIRLAREVESRARTFDLVAAVWEKGKIAVSNKTSDIQIVGKAVVPGRATRTPPAVSGFMAAVLGTLLGAAYVVSRELYAQITARMEQAKDES